MPQRLFDLYQRKRIININANIMAAGFLAIVISKYPVVLIGDWIGPENKFLITVAAAVIDMIVDVLLYYGFHWIANHWSPPWMRHRNANPQRSFFKDASVIQFERAILAPVYYLIAMGLMYAFQRAGLDHGWAFVFGFLIGIVCTRVIHTIWGMRTGRFVDLPEDDGPLGTAQSADGDDEPTERQA